MVTSSWILGEIADSSGASYLATGRQGFASQAFSKSGFAGAISAYEAGVPELGWILESSLMACEFWESAKRQGNLTLFCPAACERLDFATDAVTLVLTNGNTLSGRLLVGADGRDSWVRRSAGLAAIDTPYGEKGVVANLATERQHRNIARRKGSHEQSRMSNVEHHVGKWNRRCDCGAGLFG